MFVSYNRHKAVIDEIHHSMLLVSNRQSSNHCIIYLIKAPSAVTYLDMWDISESSTPEEHLLERVQYLCTDYMHDPTIQLYDHRRLNFDVIC